MPLLQLFTSQGQLTAAEKQELATTFTDYYSHAMPAFFVNVVFHEAFSVLHFQSSIH